MQDTQLPMISVVMPTYNQAHFLRDAVRSVLAQDYPRWELIIINNFSEDDTTKVVESFSDPRIHCEDFQNFGVIAASRNRGIELSRGRFIAFLDSDDLWYPPKLSTCLGAMTDWIDAVCHGMQIREDGILKRPLIPSPIEGDLYGTLLFRGNSSIATSSVMIRKECLARAGGFCEDREIVSCEDYELWLRLARNGTRFLILDTILGEYTVHRKGLSRNIRRQSDAEAEIVAREFRQISDNSPTKLFRKKLRTALIHLRAARRFQSAGMYREAVLSLARSMRALVR
jgi:glycosyltransferase involved in cell wall biosynthesis